MTACTQCGKAAEPMTIGGVHYVRCRGCIEALIAEIKQRIANANGKIAASDRRLAEIDQRRMQTTERRLILMGDWCAHARRGADYLIDHAEIIAAIEPGIDPTVIEADQRRVLKDAEKLRTAVWGAWERKGEAFVEQCDKAGHIFNGIRDTTQARIEVWMDIIERHHLKDGAGATALMLADVLARKPAGDAA